MKITLDEVFPSNRLEELCGGMSFAEAKWLLDALRSYHYDKPTVDEECDGANPTATRRSNQANPQHG